MVRVCERVCIVIVCACVDGLVDVFGGCVFVSVWRGGVCWCDDIPVNDGTGYDSGAPPTVGP